MADQNAAVSPVATPVVFDPPLIYIHRDSRVPPLPVYTQAQADALPPEWMHPDEWMTGGGGGDGGGGAPQSPWTGDVDAAYHILNNVYGINLSGDSGIYDNSITARNNLHVLGAVIYIGATGYPALTIYQGKISVGTSAGPAYTLDVAGDVNCSGVYRVNGVPVSVPISAGANIPQFADLAAAQAALGAGSGIVWRDPNNALFVA